jgi:hypothetical protein
LKEAKLENNIMKNILGEIKTNFEIDTREGVRVTITGVPTHIHHLPDGEEFQAHSFAVALRLEALVKAIVAQDPTPGRTAEHEFA